MNNAVYLGYRVEFVSFNVSRQSKALVQQDSGVQFPLGPLKLKVPTLVVLMKGECAQHRLPTCTHGRTGRLTQTLSGGRVQETPVLAGCPAVAIP